MYACPIGLPALKKSQAAECLGVKAHVLRDASLRLILAHTMIGRMVTDTAGQLSAALARMAANM